MDDPYVFAVAIPDKNTKNKYGKHYKLVAEDVYAPDSDMNVILYKISDFLKNKLKQYKRVRKYGFHNVWRADNHIIKMYNNKRIFTEMVDIQNEIYSKDPSVILPVLETWSPKGEVEWFVVMPYGGKNVSEFYGELDIPCDIVRKMKSKKNKLYKLGYVHVDLHAQKFVINKKGKVRIIDYDSLVPVDEVDDEEEWDWEVGCDELDYHRGINLSTR